MSTIVALYCDRCYAKLGSGNTVTEAMHDAHVHGWRRRREQDLCEPCRELDSEIWDTEDQS